MSTPEIISRQLKAHQKPFSSDEPLYWFDNSQTITEFIHTLSSVFPEGEAFFVRSVRAFVNHENIVNNKELLKDVKLFINQEAQHSAEHASYNNKIQQLYHHDMKRVNRLLKSLFWFAEKVPFTANNAYFCLGITCSLEHLTACLAEILLTTDEGLQVLNGMAPSHRTLWVWHAIEETEHKAVAFDVYEAGGGWYLSRILRHITATVIFVFVMFYLNIMFLIDGGKLFDIVGIVKLFYFLFAYPGFFRKFVPLWWEYMKPGYHPWGYGAAGRQEREYMAGVIAKWTAEQMQLQSENKTETKVEKGHGDDECRRRGKGAKN